MGKDESNQSNQLNLTVVALVALVAIVGLVALVMNAATVTKMPKLATGSEAVSAEEQNIAGDARAGGKPQVQYADWDGAWGASSGGGKKGSGSNCSADSECKSGQCRKDAAASIEAGTTVKQCV